MAMIQICDTCNTKIEKTFYILTVDEYQGIEYVNERKCRYELCPDCYDLLISYIKCLNTSADELIAQILGYHDDES